MATDLRAAIESVVDPQLDLTLGDVGMLGDVTPTRRGATVELRIPIATWPTIDELRTRIAAAAAAARRGARRRRGRGRWTRTSVRAVRARAARAHGRRRGRLATRHGSEPTAAPFLERGASTRVLGISSGKGGVGKSTVSVNLAISLAALGHRVGVLDADVYGFSVPKMVAAAVEPVVLGDTVVPTYAHGVRWLSMGWFVSDDQPVIWRGPLLHKAITQFVTEAWWGEPDFLVIDMPPGTGDVALTLSEVVPTVEVYVVTTPQPAAQRVAQRSALAARKLRLAVRGVIENMSWFDADDATRATSCSARAAAPRSPRSSACRCSASCPSSSRSARAATSARPSRSPRRDGAGGGVLRRARVEDRRSRARRASTARSSASPESAMLGARRRRHPWT